MPLASPNLEPQPHKPYFNPAQIADIIAYINALDVEHGTPGPGILDVTPACNNATSKCPTLSEGDQLFLLNCAQCHHASGAGGMLSHGNVVPSLHKANMTQIAEAMRVGARPMPNFGPGQLTNQQMSAIADYVVEPEPTLDPGGLGIANFGPVPEGFVGVIFGLWRPALRGPHDREQGIARWQNHPVGDPVVETATAEGHVPAVFTGTHDNHDGADRRHTMAR